MIVVVPGLAVTRYLEPAAAALSRHGHEVELLDAPGTPGSTCDLRRYGEALALRLGTGDVVVAQSVGCQAAAVAAARAPVRHLVLVSPTVDPRVRSWPGLLGAWLRATTAESTRLGMEQVPDWWRAGAGRLRAVMASALTVRLEEVLRTVDAPVTIVHAECDRITSHTYAAALAADGLVYERSLTNPRRLVVVPEGTHSWPYGDEDRFAQLVGNVLR